MFTTTMSKAQMWIYSIQETRLMLLSLGWHKLCHNPKFAHLFQHIVVSARTLFQHVCLNCCLINKLDEMFRDSRRSLEGRTFFGRNLISSNQMYTILRWDVQQTTHALNNSYHYYFQLIICKVSTCTRHSWWAKSSTLEIDKIAPHNAWYSIEHNPKQRNKSCLPSEQAN